MVKYREVFREMLAKHQDKFANFKEIHDNYASDPDKWKKKFDEEGEKILEIVKEYEDFLCSKQEKGTYAKFAGGLSDKFRAELKAFFPKIGMVGVEVIRGPIR